jgi:protein gp37
MYRDKDRWKKDPTEVVRVNQKTIDKVLGVAKPGDKIFTCSWSDFFIEEADEWRDWAWGIIRSRPDLHWQILTKRVDRIEQCLPDDWGDGWDNVWLGFSAENQVTFNERIAWFVNIPAKIRFVSAEPLLGEIWTFPWLNLTVENRSGKPGSAIDWVIIGGESGNETGKYRYRPCEVQWINSLVDQCKAWGVPVFVKQLGTYLAKGHVLKDRHGGDINEFPENLRIRQMPRDFQMRFCPGCKEETRQTVTLYNPDIPEEGNVWTCSVCNENTAWAD